jgi:hypothetical protein
MFPYKVYYHEDGYKDVCIAQFAFEDDAEDWADDLCSIFLESRYYYVKKYEE